MVIWLVTVRAVDGASPAVAVRLQEEVLPLLRQQPEASAPSLARCTNCGGEHTYIAYWPDRAAVERFEATHAYRQVADTLAPPLRVPPKRELRELLTT